MTQPDQLPSPFIEEHHRNINYGAWLKVGGILGTAAAAGLTWNFANGVNNDYIARTTEPAETQIISQLRYIKDLDEFFGIGKNNPVVDMSKVTVSATGHTIFELLSAHVDIDEARITGLGKCDVVIKTKDKFELGAQAVLAQDSHGDYDLIDPSKYISQGTTLKNKVGNAIPEAGSRMHAEWQAILKAAGVCSNPGDIVNLSGN